MEKHRTIQHAVLADIKLCPANSETYNDMFKFDYQKSFGIYKDADLYKFFVFNKNELDKKNKNFIKGVVKKRINEFSSYEETIKAEPEKVFFIWFEIKNKKFVSYLEDVITKYNHLIGTDEKLYFDEVVSQGMDFTYEQEYKHFVLQQEIKNEYLDLRSEFVDCPQIHITIKPEDKNSLFKNIQLFAIKELGAVYGTKYDNGRKIGFEECVVLNKIPIELRDGQLNFKNSIDFDIIDYTEKIRMSAGEDFDRFLSDLYRRNKYVKFKNIKEAKSFLLRYKSYTENVLPKLKVL